MNEHQLPTRNIRKPGDVGNLNFCTFTQIRNGLTSWSFEIPASAYCHTLPAMLERRPYKTTTRFDGLPIYFSGQTGMPKTEQSRHN